MALTPLQVLDTVLPEALVIAGSLPELLPDAQCLAKRIKEMLFLQEGLRDSKILLICTLYAVLFCRVMDQEERTSFFTPLGSSPDVLVPDNK